MKKFPIKIFYAVPKYGIPIEESSTWDMHFKSTLEDLVDTIEVFKYNYLPLVVHQDTSITSNKAIMDNLQPIMEQELLAQLDTSNKKQKIDIFFSYFTASMISIKAIEYIKSKGIVTINWFCNASYQFHLVEPIAKHYHYNLVPEKFRIENYRKSGANAFYFQESVNPNFIKPFTASSKTDLGFIGSRYGNRYSYLKSLYNQGFSVSISGRNWVKDNQSRTPLDLFRKLLNKKNIPSTSITSPIDDRGISRFIASVKINLGFATCNPPYDMIKQVRLRDFEVTACGGFYLTEDNQELYDFFEPKKEIETFKDKYELSQKVTFFLKNEKERIKIAQNGYKRFLAEHTAHHRFTTLFNTIGV